MHLFLGLLTLSTTSLKFSANIGCLVCSRYAKDNTLQLNDANFNCRRGVRAYSWKMWEHGRSLAVSMLSQQIAQGSTSCSDVADGYSSAKRIEIRAKCRCLWRRFLSSVNVAWRRIEIATDAIDTKMLPNIWKNIVDPLINLLLSLVMILCMVSLPLVRISGVTAPR